VNQVGLRAQVSGYLTEIHFHDAKLSARAICSLSSTRVHMKSSCNRRPAQRETAAAALELADKQVARTARLNQSSLQPTSFWISGHRSSVLLRRCPNGRSRHPVRAT